MFDVLGSYRVPENNAMRSSRSKEDFKTNKLSGVYKKIDPITGKIRE